jgi:hypothetical protein
VQLVTRVTGGQIIMSCPQILISERFFAGSQAIAV